MQTVISSVTLAAPGGGNPLPAGERVDVDETDPFIAALINVGTIQVVGNGPGQVWDAEGQGPTITIQPPPDAVPAAPAGDTSGTAPDSPDVHSAQRPDETWKLDGIRSYAEENNIDVPSRATKAELLEAIGRAG